MQLIRKVIVDKFVICFCLVRLNYLGKSRKKSGGTRGVQLVYNKKIRNPDTTKTSFEIISKHNLHSQNYPSRFHRINQRISPKTIKTEV